jgi:peroxiredoxin
MAIVPGVGTPGCTTQACGVRDRAVDYASASATVLGISPDPKVTPKTHDEQVLKALAEVA